jgi:hypothetical protein
MSTEGKAILNPAETTTALSTTYISNPLYNSPGPFTDAWSTDVPCKALCTFCFNPIKVFDLASEFIRHWESNHRNEDQSSAEAVFMQTKYDELERLVKEQLGKEQSLENERRKRLRVGEASDAPAAQRAKLVDLNVASTKSPLIVDKTGQATPALNQGASIPSMQPTTAFAPLSNDGPGTTGINLNDFASIAYSNQAPAPPRSIDAPLLRVFSSSPYFPEFSQDTWGTYGPGHGGNML